MIFNFYEARLDLEVIVPADLPVDVTDGSGSILIDGTDRFRFWMVRRDQCPARAR